jgi:hypothetical protein
VRKQIFFLAVAMLLMGVIVFPFMNAPYAYGHGLGKEQTPPQNVGDRLAFIRAAISPELKGYGELRDITLTLDLLDAMSGVNIRGVAYHLKIEKFADKKLLLDDVFHLANENDELTINFRTLESGAVSVRGQKLDDAVGYLAPSEGLVVEGPVFVHGGLYSFATEVISLNGKMLDVNKRATYFALLTLAEGRSYEVDYKGQKYNIGTISYFDNILDFKFDQDKKSITMTMPFDWRRDFVGQVQLLHAELFIPKEFSELANQELVGTINGVEDPIFVDRSPADEVVVHYTTPNKRLLTISDMVTQEEMRSDVLEFGLIAKGPPQGDGDGLPSPLPSPEEWSPVMETATGGGTVLVQVQWSPVTIATEQPVTFRLKFLDPETRQEINDASYDVMLFDPEGTHVDASHRSKQTAETQTYSFERTGTFTLILTNVNLSGERAEFQLSVVPEFPFAVLLVAGSMLAGALALLRFKGSSVVSVK